MSIINKKANLTETHFEGTYTDMTNNPAKGKGGTSSDQFLLLLKQHRCATLFCLFVYSGHAEAWNTFNQTEIYFFGL